MNGVKVLAITAFWAVFAGPLRAETDIFNLRPDERQILGRVIRDVLIATPELLHTDGPTVAAGYEAEVASDQALIRRHHATIFAEALPGVGVETAQLKVAFLTSPACEGCLKAEQELLELSKLHDLRVYVIDMTQHPELEENLGVDTLPFYIMPRMMLRGAMPATVLDQYFTRATGQ